MEKRQLYYPRTYRKFEANFASRCLFVLVCVLPCLLLLLLFYSEITRFLSEGVVYGLGFGGALPADQLAIATSDYLPIFGGVSFVSLPSTMPSFWFSMANLLVSLVLLCICLTGKRKGTPIAIYFSIMLFIHAISCIYFSLAGDFFPYTATQYSELYIKQEVGIWLSFMVIAGFITGFLNNASLLSRVVTFFAIMLYSFVFGCVRYLAFLYLIYTFSSLYMPVIFFALGPFFDFLYLVYIYSTFITQVVKKVDTGEGRAAWKWF